MNEPKKISAGESVTWSVTLDDYPADIWTLHYSLFNANAAYSFDTTADGLDHVVNLSSATTAAWTAGRYDWTAYVTNAGGEQKVVGTGAIVIGPNPAAAQPYDGRSHSRKMLDALEAVLEDRATAADLDMIRGTWDDRTIEREPERLIEARDKYKIEVKAEEREAAIKRGERVPRGTKVRFTR